MLISLWMLVAFGAFVAIRTTTRLVENWSRPQVEVLFSGGTIRKITHPHPSTTFIVATIALDLAFLFVLWLALSVTREVRRGE